MRKLFHASAILFAFALLFTACDDDVTTESLGENSPTMKIELTGRPDATSLKIRFTPTSDAVKFEYAIGSESQKTSFDNGTMERTVVEDNSSVEHTFESLDKNATYAVFARAYGADDTAGPTTTSLWHTSDYEVAITETYVTPESAAFLINAIPDYRTITYAFVSEADESTIAEFENGSLEGQITEEDIFAAFTVNAFDLETGAGYNLLVRGLDRMDNWTQTYIVPFTTPSKEEVPFVEAEMSYSDFYYTEFDFTPNDRIDSYYVYFIQQDVLSPSLYPLTMDGYAGNYIEYLVARSEENAGIIYDNKPNIGGYLTSALMPNAPYEVYIMAYEDGEPVSVIRRQWSTPAPDPSAGKAKVSISVTPTATGGNYTYTPNDDTYGFICETFEAILIDGDDPRDPGVKDDQWIVNYMIGNLFFYTLFDGTQWQYHHIPEFWPLAWNDDTAGDFPSGYELITVTLPFNKNGLEGIGELTKARYSKL